MDTPLDENGQYDFEGLGAMDVEQFNTDMSRLLRGETVEMPRYNFIKGIREYNGDTLTLGPQDILVIEGIHCLNEAFTYALPKENKYKIYISCLTTLNVDDHNRIPTTDARLLRRIEPGTPGPVATAPGQPSACGPPSAGGRSGTSSPIRTAPTTFSTPP